MERATVIKNLLELGERLAKELGYECVEEAEDRQKGIWGEKAVEMLEKEHGECTKVVTWYKSEETRKTDYIHFRFRFASPVLSIHKRTNKDLCASVEYSDFDCFTRTFTGNYEMHEYLVWGGKDGLALLNMLIERCDECCGTDTVYGEGE